MEKGLALMEFQSYCFVNSYLIRWLRWLGKDGSYENDKSKDCDFVGRNISFSWLFR